MTTFAVQLELWNRSHSHRLRLAHSTPFERSSKSNWKKQFQNCFKQFWKCFAFCFSQKIMF